MNIDDEQFEQLIAKAMAELPEKYMRNLDNVAITYADQPTDAQRLEMKLRHYETLFGLYEGIPLPQRGANYNLVLPDKITIFKQPIAHVSATMGDMYHHIKHTLWHEIAHHYGLGHDQIHGIEQHWT